MLVGSFLRERWLCGCGATLARQLDRFVGIRAFATVSSVRALCGLRGRKELATTLQFLSE